jgi:Gram-negative bacterial TonB protein C-terminal
VKSGERVFLAILTAYLVGAVTLNAQEPAVTESIAIKEAKENVSRMMTAPKIRGGSDAVLPGAEQALGHHGRVILNGVIGVDGHLHELTVKNSSGAPSLDVVAIHWAETQKWEPAKDSKSKPLAVFVNTPVELGAYMAGRVEKYGCRQFVLDMNWWRTTFPDAKWDDNHLFKMTAGARAAAVIFGATLSKEQFDNFEARWSSAIESCRATPERRFVDVLQPEGKILAAMEKR